MVVEVDVEVSKDPNAVGGDDGVPFCNKFSVAAKMILPCRARHRYPLEHWPPWLEILRRQAQWTMADGQCDSNHVARTCAPRVPRPARTSDDSEPVQASRAMAMRPRFKAHGNDKKIIMASVDGAHTLVLYGFVDLFFLVFGRSTDNILRNIVDNILDTYD